MKQKDIAMGSTVHTDSYLNSMFSFEIGAKERALSNDNIFSSPKGLPYFADMAFPQLDEENEEIEMHIDEDIQKRVLSNIVAEPNVNSSDNNQNEEDSIFSHSPLQFSHIEASLN